MTILGWQRPWVRVALGVALLAYVWLRVTLILYDRRVQQTEAALESLRPVVVQAVQERDSVAVVKAQQQFAAALKLRTVQWEGVFQQLSTALPPSIVLHAVSVEAGRLTLHGFLRYPPPEPQAYLARVSDELKHQGMLRDVVITVAPSDPDDPHVVRLELQGRLP